PDRLPHEILRLDARPGDRRGRQDGGARQGHPRSGLPAHGRLLQSARLALARGEGRGDGPHGPLGQVWHSRIFSRRPLTPTPWGHVSNVSSPVSPGQVGNLSHVADSPSAILLDSRGGSLRISAVRGIGPSSASGRARLARSFDWDSAAKPVWGVPRLNIRPARVGDVPAIYELIRTFADRKLMIRRSMGELYESIREFL